MKSLKTKNYFSFAVRHKAASLAVILMIAGAGYFGYQKFFTNENAPRFVLAEARKGTLVVSISGTGQVSVTNQIDLKPKVSGGVMRIGAQNGERVNAGALLIQLDARDAERVVRDAEVNLESARLSLEKLKKPPDRLSLLQAENALAQARESKQKGEDDLVKAYDDGFNTVANALLDLPAIMVGLHDVLYNSDFTQSQDNLSYYADTVKGYDEKAIQYKNDAARDYQIAKAAYDKNFQNYKATTRYSGSTSLESLLRETYQTTKSVAEAIKSASNLIQFYKDRLTERNLRYDVKADTALSSIVSYTGKTNAHLLNLLGIQNTIKNTRDSILNAERQIEEKAALLEKLEAGADALDIQSAELTVKQRENALFDAREKLADYSIRAHFDGVIAKFNVKKGDSVSSATVLGTLITAKKIAEISLNEVDVARIIIGQKTTLTFDAVPGLEITGQVAEMDAVGTVSQGVVTYAVKIIFDTQDERIKPGMSASASIVTDEKNGALLVPNAAVKSQGGEQYVEAAENTNGKILVERRGPGGTEGVLLEQSPRRRRVATGLLNDEFTEVLNGLEEGEVVVVRTIQQNSFQSSQAQQAPAVRVPGFSSGSGGFRR